MIASASMLRSANDAKDYSLWDSHRETFRRLYLTDGKPLKRVAAEMENAHGFPKAELSTYEVVLRDHFKFRKNLDSAQWLLLGRELDKRQLQGHNCLVSLSGVQLKPHLVLKNIRRARRELDKGKLKMSNQGQLPEFVEIMTDASESSFLTKPMAMDAKTPRKTASSTLYTPRRNGNATLKPRIGSNAHPGHMASSSHVQQTIDVIPRANHRRRNHGKQASQMAFQFDSFDYNWIQLLLDYPVERAHSEIRATVPSRQLLLLLQNFISGKVLIEGRDLSIVTALCDLLYMMTHNGTSVAHPPYASRRPSPQPRIFGPNSSLTVLETACHELSNGYGPGLPQTDLLEWIGTVADKALLVKFFRLQNPAVAALWWNLTLRQFPDAEQCSVLLHVGLEVREGEWFRNGVNGEFLTLCIMSGQKDLAERIVHVWATNNGLRDVRIRDPRSCLQRLPNDWEEHQCLQFVELWTEVRKHGCINSEDFELRLFRFVTALPNHQASCVRWILDASAKGGHAFEWLPKNAQELGRCLSRACLPRLSDDLWNSLMFCRIPSLRRWIRNGGWIECLAMVWTIYDAARDGKRTLERQIRSLFSHPSQERDIILELVLSEAVGLEDTNTVRTLLEYGISPDTDLLCDDSAPLVSGLRLDGLSRAARKFNVEILALLIDHGVDIERKRPLALQALLAATVQSFPVPYPPPPFRNDIVMAWPALMLLLKPHGNGKQAGTMQNIPIRSHTLEFLPIYLERLEGSQQITSHQYVELFMRLFPTDTLENAIRTGCSAMALDALLCRGMSMEPNRCYQGRTVLHDALLIPSKDRHRVVEILLQHGADPALDSDDLTTLEATLRGSLMARWLPRSHEYKEAWRSYQLQSFALFRTLAKMGARMPKNNCRLLALLIRHKAPISTIQQIISIGPHSLPLGTKYSRVLVFAILLEQFDIAEWLVGHGTDVNAGTHGGRSALETACYLAPISFIRLLLQKGANVEGSSRDWGKTPLQHIASGGCTKTASLLLSHNANVNALGKSDWKGALPMNALEWAAFCGQLDMVKFLVDCGAHSSWQKLTKFDGAFLHGREHLGVVKFFEHYTGCSYHEVISAIKTELPFTREMAEIIYPRSLTSLDDEDWQKEWWARLTLT